MTIVNRKKIDTSLQQKILKSLISSTEFCSKVLPKCDYRFFEIKIAWNIIRWVRNYYSKYEEAPKENIIEILDGNKRKLEIEDYESLKAFIETINYEEKINVKYIADQANDFFRKRALELHADEIKVLVSEEEYSEAEKRIREYQKVAKNISQWRDPFSENEIESVLLSDDDVLFSLPGVIGQFLGGFERGWLFSIMGPMKRGKTFWLLEFAVHAVLSGLKVAFVSAEMSFDKISKRIYKRITSLGDESTEYVYPIFDCLKNQYGTCIRVERTNKFALMDKGEERPEFETSYKYRICDYCRNRRELRKEYEPAVWYESYKRDKLTIPRVMKKVKGMKGMNIHSLKILCYPRFQCSVSDLENDLQNLEYTDGFCPDVIITDYADIFKPDPVSLQGRDALDNIWKMHAGMASRRNAFVVTGSQTSRDTLNKKNTEITDVAEDIRKLAHVDGGIFLSQTWKEKKLGIQRISLFHRHKYFSETDQIQVTQQLALGQPNLDSEVYRGKD